MKRCHPENHGGLAALKRFSQPPTTDSKDSQSLGTDTKTLPDSGSKAGSDKALVKLSRRFEPTMCYPAVYGQVVKTLEHAPASTAEDGR